MVQAIGLDSHPATLSRSRELESARFGSPGTEIWPRTMTRPFVNETSSRIWPIESHLPPWTRGGVMNFVQMSRSLSSFFDN
jgi:hypothetical protein